MRWVDADANEVLFTSSDVLAFDWGRQILHLESEAAMDFLAWMVPHKYLHRPIRVEDNQGTIYQGQWVNPSSSRTFSGPVYENWSPYPMVRVCNGYPASIPSAEDLRFDPRLYAALEQEGVLGPIDPNADWTELRLDRETLSWQTCGEDLRVRAEVFLNTFVIGRQARVHLFFAGGKEAQGDINDLALELCLTANNGQFQSEAWVESMPKAVIDEGVYVCRFSPWTPVEGGQTQPEQGTGQLGLGVLLRRRTGESSYEVAHRLDFPGVSVPIQEDSAPEPNEDPNEGVPPLYFFYAIHTHGSGDHLPYTDLRLLQLDTAKAENMIAAIEGIAAVLDRYGVKATWEPVTGTAKGLAAYGGKDHVFKRLQSRGHEIGAHAHKVEDTERVVRVLVEDCNIVPVTTSGFQVQISKADANEVQASMSEAIQLSVDQGLRVGTENLCPCDSKNLLSESCGNELGIGNAMWPQTGNLMFPWRPDYLTGNVCQDSPDGQFVLVDHVSINWLILPDTQGPPDVVDDRHFDQLKGYLDAALDYMETERPDRTAAWGFVTHIIEYAVGGAAENPPDPASLEALDRFLAYVDGKRAQGRVVYATAREIADLAFAPRAGASVAVQGRPSSPRPRGDG
ncbi:MAG: hypothetical protein KBE04_10900 [Phycisphaerae bacterium]|nr:hypothetical protein [Phycisphaerae bacterium]